MRNFQFKDIPKDPRYDEIQESIRLAVNAKLKVVYDQREEILEAFIAKHGFEPDDCVQVIQRTKDGGENYFIRQRTQEEREMLSRMSSQL